MWCLKKGLYGLVQAGRMWNEQLNTHAESQGFAPAPTEPAMYVKNSWTDCDFWVDDCIAIGSRKKLDVLVKSPGAKYSITGLGEVRWVLGMLLEHDGRAHTISRSKEAFIDSIIARFNLTDATTVATPLTPGEHHRAVDCPTLKDKIEEMANQPYRELVGTLA